MPVIAIPFVPMPVEQNPNVKGGGSDTYLVSSFVTFASIRRWNPEVELTFVTDRLPESAWLRRFEALGVSLSIVPFDHLPPEGFADRFLGSLYLLDVLQAVEADYLCVVDPDVYCVGALDGVLSDTSKIMALNIPSPRNDRINGLAPAEADLIHAELGEPRLVDFHFGGEFYGVPTDVRDQLLARVSIAWDHAVGAWARGRPYFTTEEHIMNFALATLDVRDAGAFVRRIWTAHGYRTVRGDEQGLLLWHLPSEKERGFRRLLGPTLDKDSWFWNAGEMEFVRRSSKAFGLSARSPVRLLLDTAGRMRRRYMDARR